MSSSAYQHEFTSGFDNRQKFQCKSAYITEKRDEVQQFRRSAKQDTEIKG